jgi:CheY-like chemotaxis protein
MSHELRTPLNAILGMTEGLQEQVFGEINQDQNKALQTIESSASHLLELINDILDVAKIESGQIELHCTPTDFDSLCKFSLTFIKQQADKKLIQLEIKTSLNPLPKVLVDERRIRQVLINLLNNAVKFTSASGKITLEIAPSTLPLGNKSFHNFLRIAVTDTGIGIAPEHVPRLFQPFIQIDNALNRQHTGTGLGLALVKRIVELHGGQVGLTSELGVGSCFTIHLPYIPCCDSLENPWDSDLDSMTFPAPASPLILLAEDNEASIVTISSYLRAKGYRLIFAKNGQEAVDLAQSATPDLILMDISMPGMDGIEAMEQIRRQSALVNLPIIALTALAMETDRHRCLAAGANDYLSKPVKLKQLTTIIEQHLISRKDTR